MNPLGIPVVSALVACRGPGGNPDDVTVGGVCGLAALPDEALDREAAVLKPGPE